jgi:hypothetical protein
VISRAAFHHRDLAHRMLHQRVGAGAVRSDAVGPALFGVEHVEGEVEQMLGHGGFGRLEVEAHRHVIHDLDGVSVPQNRRHDRLPSSSVSPVSISFSM